MLHATEEEYDILLNNLPIIGREMIEIAAKKAGIEESLYVINIPLYYDKTYFIKNHQYPTTIFEIEVESEAGKEGHLQAAKEGAEQFCSKLEELVKTKKKPFAVIFYRRRGDDKDDFDDIVNMLCNKPLISPLHAELIIVDKDGKLYLPLNYGFINIVNVMNNELKQKFGENYTQGVPLVDFSLGETPGNCPQRTLVECGAYAFNVPKILFANNGEVLGKIALEGEGFKIPAQIAPYLQTVNERCGVDYISDKRPFETFREEVASEYLKIYGKRLLTIIREDKFFKEEILKLKEMKEKGLL